MIKTTIWILALTLFLLASSAYAELTLINPCRVLDTRQPGEGPALVGQTTREIVVRGVCGIPEDATGITYNATIAGAAAPGFLTLYPGDEVLPTASSLNFAPGVAEGNAAVVKLGATEPSLSAYLATNPPGSTANLVLDVTGYHSASLATIVAANREALLANTARTTGEAFTARRWNVNGDGTVYDRLTQLTWEMKTDDGSIHDFDNRYSWSTGSPWAFDGTAKTVFLDSLNRVLFIPGEGLRCVGFAGHCDWRLPTVDELQAISEPGLPNCSAPPCTTIPGETGESVYWSSSTSQADPDGAWSVNFFNGQVLVGNKDVIIYVRAVRGGS